MNYLETDTVVTLGYVNVSQFLEPYSEVYKIPLPASNE